MLRFHDQAVVEKLEEKWLAWRNKQYVSLFDIMIKYHFDPMVHPEAPDTEDSYRLIYGSREEKKTGYEFIKLVYPIDLPLPCPSGLEVFGKNTGTAKTLCAMSSLQSCLVCSLGSNNLFDFEAAISKKT